MNLRLLVTAAFGVSSFFANSAYSAIAYGLTDENDLLTFDTATPDQLINAVALRTAANTDIQDLIGIDIRPSNNTLYGVGRLGTIYTIDPTTGIATPGASLTADAADTTAPFTSLSGSRFGLDFNPVPDRLRIVSNTRQNLRTNVATGATTTDGTINPSTSILVGAAYTNNFAGATTTTLYVLDAGTNQLLIQAPPNDGTVTVVGPLGIDASSLAGFDILTANNVDQAFAVEQVVTEGVSRLYSINLATGASTLIGTVGGGDLLDGLAVAIPEPASLGVIAGGLIFAARRRVKA